MKYINTNTGAIIDSSSKITGKAWNLVEEGTLYNQTGEVITGDVEVPATEEYTEEEEEEIDLEAMTKKQLVQLAKEQEIEVNENDKKAVIIETIAKAFE